MRSLTARWYMNPVYGSRVSSTREGLCKLPFTIYNSHNLNYNLFAYHSQLLLSRRKSAIFSCYPSALQPRPSRSAATYRSLLKSKVNTDIAVRNRNYHTATGNHMPYGITQCYLSAGSGDFPAFTPAEAGTRFSDPGGMQGWVDLGGGYILR